MLAQLDNINWGSMKHAFGTAEEVPNLIRSLVSDDETIAFEALKEMFENIMASRLELRSRSGINSFSDLYLGTGKYTHTVWNLEFAENDVPWFALAFVVYMGLGYQSTGSGS